MSSSGIQSVTSTEVETAVPTLKVMRLQKPDLHMPTTGTLETSCLLGTSMCLPDSFGVIHAGETFTAYLGALNVSKTLYVSRLTVVAQLQTPSQRWHLASSFDAGNAEGGVDIPPEGGIDSIVSHALEESGQHILRVEVGYLSGDGSTKTLRKFYRFQVTTPLIIRELTYRAGDTCVFVSISLENNGAETKGGLTICDAEFDPAPGIVAESLKVHQDNRARKDLATGAALFDECGRLEAGGSLRYLFKVIVPPDAIAQVRGIAAGDEIGKAVFTWRKACGEMGRMASSPIICPSVDTRFLPRDPASVLEGPESNFVVHVKGSGLAVDVAAAAVARSTNPALEKNSIDQLLPVTVYPVDPPSRMKLGVPSQIQFVIANHSPNEMTLQLQFRSEHMRGLSVCGSSFKNLGDIPGNGGSTMVAFRFIPLAAGLFSVQGCSIIDLVTGKEIVQPPLFNALVEAEFA